MLYVSERLGVELLFFSTNAYEFYGQVLDKSST